MLFEDTCATLSAAQHSFTVPPQATFCRSSAKPKRLSFPQPLLTYAVFSQRTAEVSIWRRLGQTHWRGVWRGVEYRPFRPETPHFIRTLAYRSCYLNCSEIWRVQFREKFDTLLMKQWNKEADHGVGPNWMRHKWKVWWTEDAELEGRDMNEFRRSKPISCKANQLVQSILMTGLQIVSIKFLDEAV